MTNDYDLDWMRGGSGECKGVYAPNTVKFLVSRLLSDPSVLRTYVRC